MKTLFISRILWRDNPFFSKLKRNFLLQQFAADENADHHYDQIKQSGRQYTENGLQRIFRRLVESGQQVFYTPHSIGKSQKQCYTEDPLEFAVLQKCSAQSYGQINDGNDGKEVHQKDHERGKGA